MHSKRMLALDRGSMARAALSRFPGPAPVLCTSFPQICSLHGDMRVVVRRLSSWQGGKTPSIRAGVRGNMQGVAMQA
eukprot:363791-Chlamydomonas_euryale.AAC.4